MDVGGESGRKPIERASSIHILKLVDGINKNIHRRVGVSGSCSRDSSGKFLHKLANVFVKLKGKYCFLVRANIFNERVSE